MNDSQFSSPSDLETLAAFIENRLSEDERRRVEERLAQDEDFYEVYTETLQTLEELGTDLDAEPVPLAPVSIAPSSGRKTWTRALTLAASLVLVSGLVLTWAIPRYSLGSTDPAGVGPRLAGQSEWHLQSLDPVLRSGSGTEPLLGEWQVLGIHLGAQITDLQVALEEQHWKIAQHAAGRLAKRIKGNPIFGADTETFFKNLAALTSPEGTEHPKLPPDKLDRHLRTLAEQNQLFEQTYKQLDSQAYRLGTWLESTRLIALTGDERSLRKRLRRLTVVERLITESYFDEYKLQRSREILDQLKLLRDVDKDQLDFQAIAKQLEDLILELGRESVPLE